MLMWNETSLNLSLYMANNKTLSEQEHHSFGVWEVLVIVLMSSIAVVGFQANLWVAVVILNNPSLRTSMTNIFVLNLVTVDLLASVLAMPLAVVAFAHRGDSNDIKICEASGFLSTCLMLCSMLTLCIISVDRFYSIAMPLRHAAHATPMIALIIALFIWITGVTVACLPCFGVNAYRYKESERICSFEWAGEKNDRVFVIIIFIVCFLVPTFVILSMYLSIFCIARKAAHTIAPHPLESTPSTIVIPEMEISRSDKSHSVIHDRQISLETSEDFVEIRRPSIRVGLSTGCNSGLSTGCNSGLSTGCNSGLSTGCNSGLSTGCNSGLSTGCNSNSKSTPERKSEMFESVQSYTTSIPREVDGEKYQHSTGCQRSQTNPVLVNRKKDNSEQNNCRMYGNESHRVNACNCCTQDYSEENNIMSDTYISCESTETTPTGNATSESSSSYRTTNATVHSASIYKASETNSKRSSSPPTHSVTNPSKQITNSNCTARHNHTKAFRTVMVIVLSYLILWGPYFVCQVQHLRGNLVSSNAQLLVSWLGFMSYSINPYIYGGMNRVIRDELSHMYREMFKWIKSFGYCLCWACCRCCVTEDFFQKDKSVLYCMPWLKKESGESSDLPEQAEEGMSRSGVFDDDGGGESFFEFLQRTQDGDTPVPLSVVLENSHQV